MKNKGTFVDLGCHTWNWSEYFLGKTPVVGVDPLEQTCPHGAKLFKGVIGPVSGKVKFRISKHIVSSSTKITEMASLTNNLEKEIITVDMITLDELCERFSIKTICALKMNIEGGEYELLMSLQERHFDKIDQMIVQFHDFIACFSKAQTQAVLSYLKNWYWIIPTLKNGSWHLLIHKRIY